MKNISIITILLFLIFSCNNPVSTKNTKTEQAVLSEQIKITDTASYIKNFIIDYYRKRAQENKEEFKIDSSEQIDGELRNDDINIIFGSTDSLTKEFSGFEHHIWPRKGNLIYGDLNGDKKNDVVANVLSDTYGSADWLEIFFFITRNNRLELQKVYNSYELGKEEKGEYLKGFYPEKIENNILQGTTFYYKENDASCCPSLEYHTEYTFKDSLVFKDKVLIDTD